MRRTGRPGEWLLFVVPIVALLVIFHFWGERQRARQWWWVGGNAEGMSFVDILHRDDERGHLLLTEARAETREAAQEVEIQWSCSDRTVTLGDMWTLDDRMQQIDRIPPPPRPQRGPRSPTPGAEQAVLEVACASVEERSRMRTVRIERPPIEVTRLATRLVNAGVRPFDALFLAAYDPAKDPEGYERILARVPDRLRSSAREIAAR